MKAKALFVIAGALFVAIASTTALAGHLSSGVKSYTGCLNPRGGDDDDGAGSIRKVKEGDQPLRPCSSREVQVHLSGGDITSVTAGTGLQGGGDNGAVSLSIRQDCGSGQVLKWNGSAWACASDSNSTYTAGTGLDLNGNEFSIEPAYRVKNTPTAQAGNSRRGSARPATSSVRRRLARGRSRAFRPTQAPWPSRGRRR